MLTLQCSGQGFELGGGGTRIGVGPGGPELGTHPGVLGVGEVTHHISLLVQSASLDHRLGAEHRRDPSGERLGAVNNEQHATRHVEAPVLKIRQQASHQGLVLGGALHHRQRHLDALCGHPQRSDQEMIRKGEPVDEHDQPPLLVQPACHQGGELLGGGGNEPARHRRA